MGERTKNKILEAEQNEAGDYMYDTYRKGLQQEQIDVLEQNPAIYEVSLTIEEGFRDPVEYWLTSEHIDEIVDLGEDIFFSAYLFRTKVGDHIKIQYYAKDESGIEKYLNQHAANMRTRVPANLQGKFTAIRRKGTIKDGTYNRENL